MTARGQYVPPAASRLTTPQVADLLTGLARARKRADDVPAVVALRDVQIWLNATTALARAAERRLPIRCPHCREMQPPLGELHDLLFLLAVEL